MLIFRSGTVGQESFLKSPFAIIFNLKRKMSNQAVSKMKGDLEKYSDKTDQYFDKSVPITADLGFMQSQEWKGMRLV